MDLWIKERLSACLQFEVPDEMIDFILSIKSQHQLEEHITSLLDSRIEKHVIFMNELKQKLYGNILPTSKSSNKGAVQKVPKKYEKKQKSGHVLEVPDTGTNKKKNIKFHNLYGEDGQTNDVFLLKGRNRCDCQASKHQLINNCLRCGRIVCEQEGSGSCLFCGHLVCSEEDQKIIDSQTKQGNHLKKSLQEQQRPEGWEKALLERNRLLEYDKNSERRTVVIDDESDYFKNNSVWLNDTEKKKLEKLESEMREKKHASRMSKTITFDFSGRQIVDEPTLPKEFEDKILNEIQEMQGINYSFDNIHPGLVDSAPIFDESVISQFPTLKNSKSSGFDGVYNKVQDKEFLEMSDQKSCLSMHQPWASLLVFGIKMHEGRSWYSSHRGRLWIASTSAKCDPDELKKLENFYRSHYKNETLECPSEFPSGVLLGCVTVQECLSQEEYRKVYPNGESDSPFVFICSENQILPIFIPIKGEHKIYKMDPTIHSAACKTLNRLKLALTNE